jgi:hypothetical protein
MFDPEAAHRLFRNARREALVVAVVWAIMLVWTVGYCYLFGYQHDEKSLAVQLGLTQPNLQRTPDIVLGFPDWIFFGIIVPWVISTIFTIWFGIKGMADDDLGVEAADEAEGHHGH